MSDLERFINSKWFDIRQKAEDSDQLCEVLELNADDLRMTVTNLEMAVEGGVVEFKRQIINDLEKTVESMRYDSKNLHRLIGQKKNISLLIYVTVIQRLICTGIIPLKQFTADSGQAEALTDESSIKEILNDLSERIQKDPAVQNIQAVKNIFLQVKIYQNELREMQKLKPNIPKEKEAGFLVNFKKRFDEITQKIIDNYRQLTSAEIEEAKAMTTSNPLARYDLKTLSGNLWQQIKTYTKVYSLLLYIEKERYKTREYLYQLESEERGLQNGLKNENDSYESLTQKETHGVSISRLLVAEITSTVEKQANWLARR